MLIVHGEEKELLIELLLELPKIPAQYKQKLHHIVAKLRDVMEKDNREQEALRAYVDAAKKLFHEEGHIEVDDDSVVSKNMEPGGDSGAYVQCWVWVNDEELLK